MMGARVGEGMNMPCAVPVPMPVGPGKRRRTRGPAVVPAISGLVPVAATVEPVVHARRTVMPIPMRMPWRALHGRPVPMATVARRMGDRRGVGVCDSEKRQERSEREPRGLISAALPVKVPPSRLGGARDGEGCSERKGREPDHRPSTSKTLSIRAPKVVCDVHHTLPHPGFANCALLRARVKAAMPGGRREGDECEGQPPVKAARHHPRSAPGKRPTTSTLRALTLMTSRSGFATARAGSPGSSKYMSLTMRR